MQVSSVIILRMFIAWALAIGTIEEFVGAFCTLGSEGRYGANSDGHQSQGRYREN
jgi:hypothetical protein